MPIQTKRELISTVKGFMCPVCQAESVQYLEDIPYEREFFERAPDGAILVDHFGETVADADGINPRVQCAACDTAYPLPDNQAVLYGGRRGRPVTKLTRPIVRETGAEHRGTPIVIELHTTLLFLRTKHARENYSLRIEDLYEMAAMRHAKAISGFTPKPRRIR